MGKNISSTSNPEVATKTEKYTDLPSSSNVVSSTMEEEEEPNEKLNTSSFANLVRATI